VESTWEVRRKGEDYQKSIFYSIWWRSDSLTKDEKTTRVWMYKRIGVKSGVRGIGRLRKAVQK
jgi:hypothetical protein